MRRLLGWRPQASRTAAAPYLLELLGLGTATAALPSISTILESLAARQPGKVAVTGVARQIDYANLNNTANALAQKLILPPGQRAGRVALLMKHDAPLIAAALGVLKAGQTVVVLNPGDPPFRWQQLLANAMPDRLITDASLLVSARETGFDLSQILVFPEPEDTPTRVPDPGVRVDENDAAFLVYTSGTTGEPKGVVLTHGSIVHNAWRYALGLGLRPNDRMLLSTALSGGQGVGTTWTALLNGATLCPYAIVEKGAVGLTAWLVEKKVSIFVATASAFRHLMLTLSDGEKLSGIRLVRLASEHATSGDHQLFAKHFSPDCQLATAYSTSETGNLTLGFYSPTDEVAAGRLPAGKPSPEIALRICDAAGKVVPRGTAGELVVQARHLSRGYWRNEELTKMRFAEVPGSSPVLRSYKTGDMACWNEKGDLVILGRADSQVKIRGYRVELGAVEAALEALDGVARAVVLPFEFDGGDTQLGTFLIPTEGTVLDGAKIRRTLMRTLPSAMIPARFSFLESFPLTSHGKVDRQALRQLSAPVVGPETNTEPLNDTEEILAGIWGMAMKRPAVGRLDNFFELGGDSLMAAVIAARIHHGFGVALNLQVFTEQPHLAGMAAWIVQKKKECIPQDAGTLPPLKPALRDQLLPLSYAQERIWQAAPTHPGANLRTRTNFIKGALDVESFRAGVNEVIRRHEILRTRFVDTESGPMQEVCPPFAMEIPLVDISGEADPDGAARAAFKKTFNEPINPAVLPLIRLMLFRMGVDEHLFVRASHHIVSDFQSWGIFASELSECYEAAKGKRPSRLAQPSLQYGDYAAWQRNSLQKNGQLYLDQLDWWKQQLHAGSKAEGKVNPLRFSFRREHPLTDVPPELGSLSRPIKQELSASLDTLSQAEYATHFTVRMAAFAALVAMDSGQKDFVLGMYTSSRQQAELHSMFGCFANLVTLRFHFDPQLSFRSWLIKVRQLITDTQAHALLPYEMLCEHMRGEGVEPPEIRAIFNFLGPQSANRVGDLILAPRPVSREPAMPWGMSVLVKRDVDDNRINFSFDAGIYDPQRVEQLADSFLRLLDGVTRCPDDPMHSCEWWQSGPGEMRQTEG